MLSGTLGLIHLLFDGHWLSSCFSTAQTVMVIFRAPKITPGPMHTSLDWPARLTCLKKMDHMVYRIPPLSHVWHSSRTPWQLKMQAEHSFKTFGINNPDTQHKRPEEPNPQHTWCANFNLMLIRMEWLEVRKRVQKTKLNISTHQRMFIGWFCFLDQRGFMA